MKKITLFISALILTSFLTMPVYAETNLKDKWQDMQWLSFKKATTTQSVNLSCVQTAVGVREKAILESYETMSSGIKSALSTRQTELLAAWGISNDKERRTARKTAWDKFNKQVKELRKTYKNSVNSIWKKFNADTKSCSVNTQGVESSSSDLSL